MKSGDLDFKTRRHLKREKYYRTGFPKRLSCHAYLKNYVPPLLELNKTEIKLFYDYPEKGDIEHIFARLVLLRLHDFTESAVNAIAFENYHSIFPLMRGLCDVLYLLKFVEKKPAYIKKFMDKTRERSIDIWDLKKEVDDKRLNTYYAYLSNMHHANRISLKLTYYKLKIDGKQEEAITIRPIDSDKLCVSAVENLTYIYSESLKIIQNIISKKWKKNHRS